MHQNPPKLFTYYKDPHYTIVHKIQPVEAVPVIAPHFLIASRPRSDCRLTLEKLPLTIFVSINQAKYPFMSDYEVEWVLTEPQWTGRSCAVSNYR